MPYYQTRVRSGYWQSYATTEYVETETTEEYNGVLVAQTFLTPRSMWLTDVELFFTQIGRSGDVRVFITRVDEAGRPSLGFKLSDSLLAQNAMVRYPEPTRVSINPVYLAAGNRYALCFITEGDHRVARVSGNEYTQGTLFYGSDGAFSTADLTKDLMFGLFAARFNSPRQEITLQQVDLSGGITDLDLDTEAVLPEGSNLEFEFQIAGRWHGLKEGDLLPTSLPTVLPLRAVMVGTRDAAPGFQLGTDRLVGSRAGLNLVHWSKARQLSANSKNISVILDVNKWDETGGHALTASLVDPSGPTEFAADASSVARVLDPGGTSTGLHRHTFAFTDALGDAGIDRYQVKIEGSRDTNKVPFVVTNRLDFAA